ncbi:hypothetical protein [Trueperella sp. LYQ143]|uniref:hypothetical protein n=1 Tax=Trueperella sp. LYQ143 TaxID=3391059 RepID=UPI003982FC42
MKVNKILGAVIFLGLAFGIIFLGTCYNRVDAMQKLFAAGVGPLPEHVIRAMQWMEYSVAAFAVSAVSAGILYIRKRR